MSSDSIVASYDSERVEPQNQPVNCSSGGIEEPKIEFHSNDGDGIARRDGIQAMVEKQP